MRLTCPCCGASYTLEVLLADRSAREAVATALTLPESLGDRLLRYIGLFRPRERALSWDRAARLLTELQAAIHAAQIERDGRIYPAPVEYWRIAIDQMLDSRERLALPIKSHGYLYEIIVGLHQRATDRSAARQEVNDERARAREGERSGRMQGAADLAGALTPSPPTPLPEGEGSAEERAAPESLSSRERGRGESALPARVPPPADFRQLVKRLTGKTAMPESESTNGQSI